MQRCWNHLNHIRDVATCFVCAKENRKYFHKGKAIVSEADCDKMLVECQDYISLNSDYITSLWNATSELKPDPRKLGPDSIKEFYAYMKKANVSGLIKAYRTEKRNSKGRRIFGNQICARMMRLTHPPIISAVAQTLETVGNDFGLSDSSRNLESVTFDGNPFEGDVAILSPVDNMFVSYDGGKGTGQDVLSGNFKPMNFSVCFP